MSRFTDLRCVLAVRDLAVSTRFYTEVMGFQLDSIDAPGWSFLSRDVVRLMLGECPDALPAGELGDHSWFVQVMMEGLDAYHDEVKARGAEILSPLEDKPWGLRDFSVLTPDGHRIGFSQPIAR